MSPHTPTLEALPAVETCGEDPRFLSEQIITYLGNKRALLPFIGRGLELAKQRLGRERLSLLDLFSGSGVVARFFKAHAERLIVNDLEAYSRVCNQCYLSDAESVNWPNLEELQRDLRGRIASWDGTGFIEELYSPRDAQAVKPGERCFYTRRNARFLDAAASLLQPLPEPQRSLLLAPLLARASVHANTSGIFKGFHKDRQGVGQFGGAARDALSRILGEIDLDLPRLSRFRCPVEIHQADANRLVGDLPEVDLVYLDPPYNQHPYGSNYFMLNLLVDYRRPSAYSRVSGIPVDWNRSRYNQRRAAEESLFGLVRAVRAKFVLLSYNSEGYIAHERLVECLSAAGRLTVLDTPYNTFRGSRNLRARPLHVREFLYLLEKR